MSESLLSCHFSVICWLTLAGLRRNRALFPSLSHLQYFMKSYGAVMATCGAAIPSGNFPASDYSVCFGLFLWASVNKKHKLTSRVFLRSSIGCEKSCAEYREWTFILLTQHCARPHVVVSTSDITEVLNKMSRAGVTCVLAHDDGEYKFASLCLCR